MGWGDILKWGGGIVAAPFTGGTSLLPALATAGVSAGAQYGLSKLLGGGGGRDTSTTAAAGSTGGMDADALARLRDHAMRLGARGAQLGEQGTTTTQPVLDYYGKLLSGDANALAEATQPERGRVLDQYDTARRAMAQFAPRGGGTTSAVAQSYTQQAQQLADITSTARRSAAELFASLGPQLASLGLTAEQLEAADLNTIINAALNREYLQTSSDLQRRGQNLGLAGGIGEAAGSLLGLYLTRKGGAWERAGA